MFSSLMSYGCVRNLKNKQPIVALWVFDRAHFILYFLNFYEFGHSNKMVRGKYSR